MRGCNSNLSRMRLAFWYVEICLPKVLETSLGRRICPFSACNELVYLHGTYSQLSRPKHDSGS